ncbi:MAG: hypothetical protein QG672_1639 [Pseudomonadota bacterium]|jgi:DNA-binding transcriptional MocR family regulator|nr:hypothetical protein [Pseudomonadota bacterium]
MDYEALATSFALLYGNPPKSLRYRNNVFGATDGRAQTYRNAVEKFIREQHPHATRTRELLKRRRNDVLRALYKQMGIDSK